MNRATCEFLYRLDVFIEARAEEVLAVKGGAAFKDNTDFDRVTQNAQDAKDDLKDALEAVLAARPEG